MKLGIDCYSFVFFMTSYWILVRLCFDPKWSQIHFNYHYKRQCLNYFDCYTGFDLFDIISWIWYQFLLAFMVLLECESLHFAFDFDFVLVLLIQNSSFLILAFVIIFWVLIWWTIIVRSVLRLGWWIWLICNWRVDKIILNVSTFDEHSTFLISFAFPYEESISSLVSMSLLWLFDFNFWFWLFLKLVCSCEFVLWSDVGKFFLNSHQNCGSHLLYLFHWCTCIWLLCMLDSKSFVLAEKIGFLFFWTDFFCIIFLSLLLYFSYKSVFSIISVWIWFFCLFISVVVSIVAHW